MINIGDRYGDLEVIKKLSGKLYLCKCKCGRRKRTKEEELSTKYSNYICEHKTNIKDITGQRFGDWLVLYPTKAGYWMCECQCENKTRKEVYGTTLRNGESTSCGHDTTAFKDLTGQIFGNWKVLGYSGNHYWKCECQCENHTVRDVHRYSLITGKSKSCGCKSVEIIQKSLIKGGYTQERTDEQIKIVSSKDSLEEFIKKFIEDSGYKPTINELSNILSLNRTSVGVYIHKYSLENLVDINSAVSEKEKELRKYIEGIYNKDIIYNSRIVIPGKELDIYIPDKQLAIEFNGNYWHSSIFKDKYYHQQKTLDCIKMGVRLIHIFEYEWDDKDKQQKIKNMLRDILCDTKAIYARSTEIKEINNDTAKQFIDEFHLGGSINSSISLGCFYDKQLVGTITFGKPRFDNNEQYELLRMCYKSGINVVGGTEKMLKTFIERYKPRSIVSYCDISKFDGSSYTRIGFSTDKDCLTKPGYVWVDSHNNNVITRYMSQKHRLLKAGLGTEEQTEDEIMKENGYLKIYNSGNQKFIMKIDYTLK